VSEVSNRVAEKQLAKVLAEIPTTVAAYSMPVANRHGVHHRTENRGWPRTFIGECAGEDLPIRHPLPLASIRYAHTAFSKLYWLERSFRR
jgi:hypothetical protein